MYKKKQAKSSFRNFAKFVLLTQSASDSGKGYIRNKKNALKAEQYGYTLKVHYVMQAVACINRSRMGNVFVCRNYDVYGNIIYFNIKGFGQISFHIPYFERCGKLLKKICVVEDAWNGIAGGSLMTCRKLVKKLSLKNFY